MIHRRDAEGAEDGVQFQKFLCVLCVSAVKNSGPTRIRGEINIWRLENRFEKMYQEARVKWISLAS
jgi:hypothetical protein